MASARTALAMRAWTELAVSRRPEDTAAAIDDAFALMKRPVCEGGIAWVPPESM
jgi:hypothetical protein